MSGTTPEPPATSCTGSDCAARQVNQPPTGPRTSSGSPTPTTRARYGETSRSRRASPRRSRPARSVAPVPLLAPWVPVIVIAEALPEAWLVLQPEGDAADPLGALPQVQVRHEQPGRPAVLRRELLAVVAEGDPRLPVHQIFERQVGRIAAIGVHERVVGGRVDAAEQVV